jgi:aldose 1-epimerase
MASLEPAPFGHLPDGRSVRLYTLESDVLRVRITDYGGRMVSIEAPDRQGVRAHVLLGFDGIAPYLGGGSFGALLGRVANRIAGGRFVLDGQLHHLPTNEGTSTLHGGPAGFGSLLWTVAEATGGPSPRLVLTHTSPDGDMGFPGELVVQATYRLAGDTLWLEFEASTTRPTLVNLSAHPYFNLAGERSSTVLDHEMTIAAAAFLPTDRAQIPTGEQRPVAGTPFDFRVPTALGARIRAADEQILAAAGYDHCFVLNGSSPAARLRDPLSGRVLELHTDQPGLQLYTGNRLDGSVAGRGGTYRQSAGVALEAQGLPDAIHHAGFPSVVLRPDETYRHRTGYRFTVA